MLSYETRRLMLNRRQHYLYAHMLNILLQYWLNSVLNTMLLELEGIGFTVEIFLLTCTRAEIEIVICDQLTLAPVRWHHSPVNATANASMAASIS